jgi:hypothetical protein
MLGALIETELIAAIVSTSLQPLMTLAMTLWKVHVAFSKGLSWSIRAIIQTSQCATIPSHIRVITITSAIIAYSSLAAMKRVLRIQNIDIYENQGIRTVFQIAADAVQSVFTCTSSKSAQSILITILRTWIS